MGLRLTPEIRFIQDNSLDELEQVRGRVCDSVGVGSPLLLVFVISGHCVRFGCWMLLNVGAFDHCY